MGHDDSRRPRGPVLLLGAVVAVVVGVVIGLGPGDGAPVASTPGSPPSAHMSQVGRLLSGQENSVGRVCEAVIGLRDVATGYLEGPAGRRRLAEAMGAIRPVLDSFRRSSPRLERHLAALVLIAQRANSAERPSAYSMSRLDDKATALLRGDLRECGGITVLHPVHTKPPKASR